MKNIHFHYFEDVHVLEVYNGPIHPRYNLTSQNDEAFRAEVQILASVAAYAIASSLGTK